MNSITLGPICVFGFSIIWTIAIAHYSRLLKDNTAFAINFSRAMVALPLFILATFFLAGGISEGLESFHTIRLSHWGWFTLAIITSLGFGDALFWWSTKELGVPVALALASCFPIWTVLAGYFFAGEKISFFQMLGLMITVSGMIIVILNAPKEISQKQSRFSTVGVLLGISTSIAWAVNSFAVSRGGADLTSEVANTLRMFLAMIMCAGFGKLLFKGSSIILSYKEIIRNLWLFVLEAFVGSFLYIYGMSHSSLALGSTLSALAPIISVPVTLILKLEKFSLVRTIGVSVVVFGIWLLIGGLD